MFSSNDLAQHRQALRDALLWKPSHGLDVYECDCEISEEDYDADGPAPIFLGRTFNTASCKRHGGRA